MPGTNLIVPVVLWGKQAPTHCVSAVYLSRDTRTLLTGCYDGQVCVWQVDPETLRMSPKCLLVGHTAPVTCLCRASISQDNNFIVSSSEAGEMCVWDIVDGKCRESVKMSYVHTNIQAYHMCNCDDLRLFCNGYYAEILIVDPFSLEVLFSLSSKVNPDWISALHVLRPSARKDDVVLAISITGTVKVWSLLGHENKHSEPIYENESKQIRCLNALSLNCCSYNQRTVLIVCAKYCQIYDAGDFSVLCSITAPAGERWMSGDFLSPDRVLLCSTEGKGYLYKLPANSVPDHKGFHGPTVDHDSPILYCILAHPDNKLLSCPPSMRYLVSSSGGKQRRLLLRGDSEGVVSVWSVPEPGTPLPAHKLPSFPPIVMTSLDTAWAEMNPSPVGILDQLCHPEEPEIKLTASIYLSGANRLVVGRDDGSIIIVNATHTVMLQLLHGNHQQFHDWPPHQMLLAHNGRVNCLLYPHHVHPRYDKSHLVSGGIDFAVCLWDLYSGVLLHRFCVHAGEIAQLLVPPHACSARIQKCICSIASDHSVTLLSLTERKCVTLASRHVFPVVNIKWRPSDDFMVVGCSDGTVYVWQMETGHLDRVLHGMIAEEVLYACDETIADELGGSTMAGAGADMQGLANPAVHFFRGLRHRNMSAIKQATARGLAALQGAPGAAGPGPLAEPARARRAPLAVQGFRSNPKDPESHILFFDIEGLIVELLSDEYSAMSPASLQAAGLITNEYAQLAALTHSASPDATKRISGILAKMKEGAETVQTKLQSKADQLKGHGDDKDGGQSSKRQRPSNVLAAEPPHTMEIAQILISLLHAWGLDPDLDRVCESKLGLLRPMVPICFGVVSKSGHLSVQLPTWVGAGTAGAVAAPEDRLLLESQLPPELLRRERLTRIFTCKLHWELSSTLTSTHLLALMSLAYTLMSMNNATFVPEQEFNRRLHRPSTRSSTSWADEEREEQLAAQQTHIKQGWSLLSTLHCVLLPDKLLAAGSKSFKRPQVEMMARRWQHHCLEVREAAHALLLAELSRLGAKGRKALVDQWAQYLPEYTQTESINPQAAAPAAPAAPTKPGDPPPPLSLEQAEEEFEEEEEEIVRKPSSLAELKRKQTTAVVLLGVIGAEFGEDVNNEGAGSTRRRREGDTSSRKGSYVEGFAVNSSNNLARLTALALSHLLLAPPSRRLPAHTPLRRAAVDLVGRGFVVWEPYIDVSRVLMGLLEMCSDADKLVPSMTYGLPLTPQADTCRTARQALTLIATTKPASFITTIAREVARCAAAGGAGGAAQHSPAHRALQRGGAEVLRGIELLIDRMHGEVAELLVEVMDIILHCVDHSHLKSKGLNEVFPAICRFNQVSHCPATRRIAVGSHKGKLAMYELRVGRCQSLVAHQGPVTACAFSPDGRYLVSYATADNRLSFWQTTTGMFGLGASQTRCVKYYSTAPMADVARLNPARLARLVWTNARTVTLMLADGSETRFNV